MKRRIPLLTLFLSCFAWSCGDGGGGATGAGGGSAGGHPASSGGNGGVSGGGGSTGGGGSSTGGSGGSNAGTGGTTGAGGGGKSGVDGGGTAGAGGGGKLGTDGGGGSGGAATSGDGGTCSDACAASKGGVTIGCEKRFHYGVNYAWSANGFGTDFGGLPQWNQTGVSGNRAQRLAELQDMAANGVDVIRWWVFADFRGAGVTFDAASTPTGLGGTLAADIAAALDIAAQAGVHIQFTLFSFDGFRPTRTDTGVVIRSLADIVTDTTKRAALINNVVKPFAAEVQKSPNRARLISWDVINEPEWAISGNDPLDNVAFDPQSTLTSVPFATMSAFVKDVVTALHAGSDRPVTVGGAAVKWGKAWSQVGVDFYTVHLYSWVDQYYPYDHTLASYGLTDKPVVLGEFALNGLLDRKDKNANPLPDVPYQTLVNTMYDLGYAGAMGWSFNSDPAFGDWATSKTDIKAVATAKGCVTRY